MPVPEFGLDVSSGGVCAVAANLDADADEELIVCTTDASSGGGMGTRLYDFDGTRFVDRTSALGIQPFSALDMEVADFDGDSLPDLAQLRANRLRVSLGSPTGPVRLTAFFRTDEP